MTNEQLFFCVALACVLSIGSFAVYLARRVIRLEREIEDLKAPPF